MKFRSGKLVHSACALSLYLPALAFASIQPTVTVGPVPAPPAAVEPEVVPVMQSGLVVALGLLLAVIALRFLRRRPAYQKFLCLGALCGGTLVTALSVDQSVAGLAPVIVPAEDSVCSSGEKTYNVSFFNTVDITNNCESSSLEILRYDEFEYCGGIAGGGPMVSTNGGVGAIIEPGATVQSDYCQI